MKCITCNRSHFLGETCNQNNFSGNLLDRLSKYDLPISKFEPILPNYELCKTELPPYLPTVPVKDNLNNVIGYRDMMSNTIHTFGGGLPYTIQLNTVRDHMGRMVGELGPGNMVFPGTTFRLPDPDF